ncbi:hypothetical protein IE81DRAFT_221372 [Ceraceosorus guamensis]|uniref:Nucleoporin Nup82 n=1 Tax=Ceraceosorus guamensis TaxID=1522189 RepID=A0A316VSV0_9BASI|nr:hypothetical protein IE81DRAFT_221372 [Ceraceosorus guamensis]PWN40450.1 hypothetical protein IE81DRAFT_221372 [Ceraceosorus guamensis]
MSTQSSGPYSYAQSPSPPETDLDALSFDSEWLNALPFHPIFSWAGTPTKQPASTPKSNVVISGSTLYVAQGRQLRQISLVSAKHAALEGLRGGLSLESVLAAETYTLLAPQLRQDRYAQPFARPRSTTPGPSASHADSQEVDFDFEIQSLVVNPTGRLIAVVGTHRLVVLVLPRSAQSGHSSGNGQQIKSLNCLADRVGEWFHDERASNGADSDNAICQVKWHPWSVDGLAMLVCTRDGMLREYNAATPGDPVQTVSLLPSASANSAPHADAYRRSTRSPSYGFAHSAPSSAQPGSNRRTSASFSDIAEGRSSKRCASFVLGVRETEERAGVDSGARQPGLGEDEGAHPTQQEKHSTTLSQGWEALTVWSVAENGDFYALCPYLPVHANIPLQLLPTLSAMSQSLSPNDPMRSQALRYVSALQRQAQSQLESPTRSRKDEDTAASEGSVRVQPPPRQSGNNITLQGPCLLSSSPHELSDVREALVTDLLLLHPSPLEESSAPPASLDSARFEVAVVASDDGRLDLAILPRLSPSWGKNIKTASSKRVQRGTVQSSNRYGFHDSSDEDQDDSDESTSPSILLYETVSLGVQESVVARLSPEKREDLSALEAAFSSQRTTLVQDALYDDTFYAHHSLGAHAICVGEWARSISTALAKEADSEDAPRSGAPLDQVIREAPPSTVRWAVKTSAALLPSQDTPAHPLSGLCIMTDVYLSYALIALSPGQSGGVAALELSMRVPGQPEPSDGDLTVDCTKSVGGKPAEDATASSAYTSLLGEGFSLPTIFKDALGLGPGNTSNVTTSRIISSPSVGKGKEIDMTAETLRALGQSAQSFRIKARAVTSAVQAVQARLDLQLRELERQLKKFEGVKQKVGLQQQQYKHAELTENVNERIERVAKRQKELVKRTDRLLQDLMDKHQPVLSIYEVKWFEELKQLKSVVGLKREVDDDEHGQRGAIGADLSTQVEKLSYQLSTLRPQLRTLQLSQRSTVARAGQPGVRQLATVQSALTKEAALLVEAREKIKNLSGRVARETREARATRRA